MAIWPISQRIPVERLAGGQPRSIAELTDVEFEPETLTQAQAYLQQVSAQWDRTLARLKAFVES